MKKLISIISPAFNEEGNIERCYEEVRAIMAPLSDQYEYEHLFGDNCSSDRTLEILGGPPLGAGCHGLDLLSGFIHAFASRRDSDRR